MKLLFASQNKNKIEEVRNILNDYEIVSLNDLNDDYDVEETGLTFNDNSYLKAKYYFDKYKLPTFSDDSGLCVDYLNGAPGVNSARFTPNRNSTENNNKLLNLLDGVNNRTAHFSCVICYIDEKNVNFFEGLLFGEIATKAKGNYGFGYDPIFYIKEFNKTLSELSNKDKNAISHRRKALEKLKNYLNCEVL